MSALSLRVGLPCLVVSLLLLTAGCGEQLASVSGTVKFKEKDKEVPLEQGQIAFVSEGRKKRVITGVITKGKYEVGGVPVGKTQVTIQGIIPVEPKAKPIKDKTT